MTVNIPNSSTSVSWTSWPTTGTTSTNIHEAPEGLPDRRVAAFSAGIVLGTVLGALAVTVTLAWYVARL